VMENVKVSSSSIKFQHNVASFDSGSVVPIEQPANPVAGNRWYNKDNSKLYTYSGDAWDAGVDVPQTRPDVPAAGQRYFNPENNRIHTAKREVNRNLYIGLVGGSLQGTLNNVTVEYSSLELIQRGLNGTYDGADVATAGTY